MYEHTSMYEHPMTTVIERILFDSASSAQVSLASRADRRFDSGSCAPVSRVCMRFKKHFLDTEDIKHKIADAEAHSGNSCAAMELVWPAT